MSLGADGLEFDVHLSRDGVVVVHHDATLERTTNGHGPVAALTADELSRLDAGYHFGWSRVRLRRPELFRLRRAKPRNIRSAVWLAACRALTRCCAAIPRPPASSN